MNVLITAATPKEIKPLIDAMQVQTALSHVSVLITGIGLTATAYSLTRQFALFKPELVIQAGIAGSFESSIELGSVFSIGRDLIADQGVAEKGAWLTVHDMKLVKQSQFPYSNGWLVNRSAIIKNTSLKAVKAVSVNNVTTNKKTIAKYKEKFNPVIESMEGAAFHYVCLMEKIPFLQIRGVSNYIGERNKKKWDFQGSIMNLNQELIRLLLTV